MPYFNGQLFPSRKTVRRNNERAPFAASPPLTQTKKGREFLRITLLNVATVLLMVVLSLTSTQSLTQMYTAPTVIVMILIISIQLLIGTSLFL